MLAIGACASLTGARSYVAISEWATAQGQAVLDCLDGDASRSELGSGATSYLPGRASWRRAGRVVVMCVPDERAGPAG